MDEFKPGTVVWAIDSGDTVYRLQCVKRLTVIKRTPLGYRMGYVSFGSPSSGVFLDKNFSFYSTFDDCKKALIAKIERQVEVSEARHMKQVNMMIEIVAADEGALTW